MGFFGGDKEHHDDGSVTERFSDGTSVTSNSDGSTREYTSHETEFPLGVGDTQTVTYDGNGEIINVQDGWGDKA